MKLRPDDEIRRARLVYLGWGRNPLPVQWTYAKWLLFLAVFAATSLLFFAVFRTLAVTLFTFAVSLLVTSWISDRVDADRPARKVIRTVLTDWRTTPDDEDDAALPAFDASHIRLGRRP
jgi:hypothetical protein